VDWWLIIVIIIGVSGVLGVIIRRISERFRRVAATGGFAVLLDYTTLRRKLDLDHPEAPRNRWRAILGTGGFALLIKPVGMEGGTPQRGVPV